jgi:pimeloyl-ACP methyl ester carboxylesterase
VLKNLAAAGFVVALPTFPLTSGPHGWDNLGQTIEQPADVGFIIGELLARSAAGDDLLGDHLSPGAVAIAGHSLGAITSLLFYNTCCRDERVKAVVAVSGITFGGRTGSDSYDDPPKIPLLLLHGEKDTTLRYDIGSRQVYDKTLTPVPRALVSFPSDGHIGLLGSPSFMPAIVAFLDLELRHDPGEWHELDSTIAENDDARIEVAGGLPAPTG